MSAPASSKKSKKSDSKREFGALADYFFPEVACAYIAHVIDAPFTPSQLWYFVREGKLRLWFDLRTKWPARRGELVCGDAASKLSVSLPVFDGDYGEPNEDYAWAPGEFEWEETRWFVSQTQTGHVDTHCRQFGANTVLTNFSQPQEIEGLWPLSLHGEGIHYVTALLARARGECVPPQCAARGIYLLDRHTSQGDAPLAAWELLDLTQQEGEYRACVSVPPYFSPMIRRTDINEFLISELHVDPESVGNRFQEAFVLLGRMFEVHYPLEKRGAQERLFEEVGREGLSGLSRSTLTQLAPASRAAYERALRRARLEGRAGT